MRAAFTADEKKRKNADGTQEMQPASGSVLTREILSARSTPAEKMFFSAGYADADGSPLLDFKGEKVYLGNMFME